MIELMVGRELKDEFPKRIAPIGAVLLTASDLSRPPLVKAFTLQLRAGEVVALTGLVGSGRTEAARLIFGADQRATGEIGRGGRVVKIRTPRDAIAAGIGFLTEDRKLQGLVLQHSVRMNFALPNLAWLSRAGFVQRALELRHFRRYAESLRIKIPDPDELARNLSGGNQQKVVLAKWLARDCEVLIFDEPTRGVDVGAKVEIYQLMNELAARGKAILMISSELPEVLGMADRIIVMREGRITGEINDVSTTSQEEIMNLAVA
jgi:ABC-type sugar transport system ATPase subunit